MQTEIAAESYNDGVDVSTVSVHVKMPGRLGMRINDIPRRVIEDPAGRDAVLTMLAIEFKADLATYFDMLLKNGVHAIV